jgi:hypothetical protein
VHLAPDAEPDQPLLLRSLARPGRQLADRILNT